jgi:DNA replication licensing factor MCM4
VHACVPFSRSQVVRVQEAPEHMPDGDTPHTIDVYFFDSLVDVAKPGDRVAITGIYRGVCR